MCSQWLSRPTQAYQCVPVTWNEDCGNSLWGLELAVFRVALPKRAGNAIGAALDLLRWANAPMLAAKGHPEAPEAELSHTDCMALPTGKPSPGAKTVLHAMPLMLRHGS